MHTTDTQKLIVEVALGMAGVPVREGTDNRLVEQVAQAMLMIEAAGLQSYMLKGFQWSCASRGANTIEVQENENHLAQAADQLDFHVHNERGAAARRLRANRRRRYKAMGLDVALIHDDCQLRWQNLQYRREARRREALGISRDRAA